jgi:hypothetical protein
MAKEFGKDIKSMMKKAPAGKISDPRKDTGKAKVMAKPFGFGKQQKQGMKGAPTQYGSA